MTSLANYTDHQLDMALELAILEAEIRLNARELGMAIVAPVDRVKVISLADHARMLRGMFCSLMQAYLVLYGD